MSLIQKRRRRVGKQFAFNKYGMRGHFTNQYFLLTVRGRYILKLDRERK